MFPRRNSSARAMDDDDTISLTSTQDSYHSDDSQFPVDRVLAERIINGKRQYLLLWDGYPVDRASWEPKENICEPSMLIKWKERKAREAKGLAKPFDVADFEAKAERARREKKSRQLRRDAKRKRLALTNRTPDADESDDEAAEEIFVPDDSRGFKNVSSNTSKLPAPNTKADRRDNDNRSTLQALSSRSANQPGAKPPLERARISKAADKDRLVSNSSSDVPLAALRPRPAASSDLNQPLSSKRPQANRQDSPKRTDAASGKPKFPPPTSANHTSRMEGIPVGRGSGAMHGASPVPKNVFATRTIVKKRPTLLESSTRPNGESKHFTTMRTLRKAEVAIRDKDVAPDVDSLGGLFKPGERPQRMTSTGVRNPPVNLFDRRDSRSENDLRNTINHAASDQSSMPAAGSRKICYFWNLHNGVSNACAKGYLCHLLHERRPGAVVADPPPGHSSMQINNPPGLQDVADDNPTLGLYKTVCHFWRKDGYCKKGSSCPFLHTDNPRVPVSKPPAKDPMAQLRTDSRPRCFYWVNRGGACKLGDGCLYIHSSDTSIPVQPRPFASQTCPFWANGYCKNTAAECTYLHGDIKKAPGREAFQQPLVSAPPPVAASATYQRSSTKKTVSFAEPILPVTYSAEEPVSFSEAPKRMISPPPFQGYIPPPAKLVKTKVTMEAYQRRNTVRDLGSRAKTFTFGTSTQQRAISLDVGVGPVSEQQWRQSFASLGEIRFTQICMAADFKTQLQLGEYTILWQDDLAPLNVIDSKSSKFASKVADNLRLIVSGLASCLGDFEILVYPAGAEEWTFLEEEPQARRVKLRYILYQSRSNIQACLSNPVLKSSAMQLTTQPRTPNTTKITVKPAAKSTASVPPFKRLVELATSLSIDRLHRVKDKPQTAAFYLIFPGDRLPTRDLVGQYVSACRPGCKIYTSDAPGSWAFFVNSAKFGDGVILMHESFCCELAETPFLQDMLRSRKKNYTFWYITDPPPNDYQMFPSVPSLLSLLRQQRKELEEPDPDFGKITAERLFPHGGVIFLTPSFLAAEPERTFELLKWFFGPRSGLGKINRTTPHTWKLVTCRHFIDYMFDLALAKAEERDIFNANNRDRPSKDAEAVKFGLGWESCNTRFAIHQFLKEVHSTAVLQYAPHRLSDPLEWLDQDERTDPIKYLEYSDPDDETALSEEFAGWAFSRMDTYRKFIILGTDLKSLFKAKRLREVPIGSEVPKQRTVGTRPRHQPLAKEIESASSRAKKDGPAKSAINPERQKALEVAASAVNFRQQGTALPHLRTTNLEPSALSQSDAPSNDHPVSSGMESRRMSHDGIQVDENDRRSIPPSQRPSGSVKKNGPVKSGYTPDEERAFYKALKTGTATSIEFTSASNASSRAVSIAESPVYSSAGEAPMDLSSNPPTPTKQTSAPSDERPKSSSTETSENEEPSVEYKIMEFEGTTVWFERLKKARGGGPMWQHVYVDSWEGVFKYCDVNVPRY